MVRKPNEWMPLHIRKYLGDTMHLTRDQHGAYLLLIMAYWMRGGPLPGNDNELAAIAKASRGEWARLKPALEPFFTIEGGKWVQKRTEEELSKANDNIEAKSEAGKAGAAARWHSDGKRNASANGKCMADASVRQWQTDAPLPLPEPVEEKVSIPARKRASKPVVEPESFADFWQAYPLSKARPDAVKAYSQALGRGADPAALLAGARRYAAEMRGEEKKFIKHAGGWIRDERWKDSETGQVIRPTAFNSPEEQENQRKLKESAYGKA